MPGSEVSDPEAPGPERGDAASSGPDRDAGWQRVHPLSPFVRGWVVILAIVIAAGREWFEALLTGREADGWWSRLPLHVLMLAGVGLVLIVGGGFVLSWATTRYRLDGETVRLHTGILFRQQRQARLDRVQAIDVEQPFLAKILGLASLSFEVADAGESTLKLSFLTLDGAQRLRVAANSAVALARGLPEEPVSPGEPPSLPPGVPGVPGAAGPGLSASGRGLGGVFGGGASQAAAEEREEEVLHLPPARILASAALSGTGVMIVLLAALGLTVAFLGEARFLGVFLVPGVLAAVAALWGHLNSSWNFVLRRAGDGLRLSSGLLATCSQSIPAGRVQAIGISQPLLWRGPGWWAVRLNVAGYGATDASGSEAKSLVLPVGTKEEVFRLLGILLPDPGLGGPEEARAVVVAGLEGSGEAEGFVNGPREARWMDPWGWRRNGYRATRTAVLCRSGALRRLLEVVPHERTQSIALRQGPLQRRLGLAGVRLHSIAGPVRPGVRQLAVVDAERLFAEQAARAATARVRESAMGGSHGEALGGPALEQGVLGPARKE